MTQRVSMAKKKKKGPVKGGRRTRDKRIRVTVTIPGSMVPKLDRVADAAGESRSALISRILADSLELEEVQVKAFADATVRNAFIRAITAPGVLAAMTAAMGRDLDADQLRLFEEAMKGVQS